MINQQKFPKGFLWGASTASHQVEGGTVNQWSEWELANAAKLAETAEARLGYLRDWNAIKAQATDPNNYISGKAVDHYHRYEEDFDLAKKLQLNSLRFGLEWSRINPEEGIWDKEAIAHYHRYIDAMRVRGLEPVLNIWHWTMPTWFTDKGGFEKKENLVYFDRFVQKVAEEYADKVDYVITLNEPNVYATFSYLMGDWPPQQKSYIGFCKVYWHLTRAHRRAYTILKARRSTLQIGVAAQLANIQTKRPHNVLDNLTTKWMRYFWNWWFINRISHYQDFIGINYYFTDYYKAFGKRSSPKVPTNDLGWYMEPEGLYPLMIRAWTRFKRPIMITENGVADRNDAYRQWWIEQTSIAMQRALSEGVVLKGYMHWSLLDNFEWKYGWWPQFGLVHVDRANNMKRTPRPSAIWFARYLHGLRGESPEGNNKPKTPSVNVEVSKPNPAPAQPVAARPVSTRPAAYQRPISSVRDTSSVSPTLRRLKTSPKRRSGGRMPL